MSELGDIKLASLAIRPMQSQDLAAVLVIERNAHVSPWSRLSFEESLTRSEKSLTRSEEPLTHGEESLTHGEESLTHDDQESTSSQAAPYYCRVLEHEDTLLAYYIVSRVADELHVLNVVVAVPGQGSGLGHVLMQDIEHLARDLNVSKIFLEVRASNEPAQGLYRKWQFEQIAIRKNYYSNAALNQSAISNQSEAKLNTGREDALVFMRAL